MKVSVVYALPDRQLVAELDVHAGATVAEAVTRSGVCAEFPDAAQAPVGIFGNVVSRDTVLRSGDRVEIYRPLQMEPKEARRLRVKRR